MLVLCHMLIGAVIGLMLYRRTGVRSLVPLATLGAILPDLIDKPLGHVILQSTLDSGRIYAHALLFVGMVALAGVLYWRSKTSLAILAVAAGVASHLVLDNMWGDPVALLWPALGPFQPHHFPNYFEGSILTEITSPMEWLFGLSLAMLLLSLYGKEMGSSARTVDQWTERYRGLLFVLLATGGATMLLYTLLFSADHPVEVQYGLTVGTAAVLAGCYLIAYERNRPSPQGGPGASRPSRG